MDIKSYKDFEVEECLVQFYQRDDLNGTRGWWWHCTTCNDASAKHADRDRRRRKLRAHGHKTESDAMFGATMHAKQKRINRQLLAWRAWWTKEFYTAKDLEYFKRLWDVMYGRYQWEHRRTDLTEEQCMRFLQTGKVEELNLYSKHQELRAEQVLGTI